MDIRIIDHVAPDSLVGVAIQDLVRNQLANDQSLEATLNQIAFDSGKTLLIGGFIDDKLATMNAFMPQVFERSGARIVGYQSGFSATGGEHRGKGYWPKLMSASMDLLRGENGHFVFGFPNPISQPLFEKKLGFMTTPTWRVILPALMARAARFELQRTSDFYRPDLRELANSKRIADAKLVEVQTNGSFAFGKVRKKKGFRYVDVGGMTNGDNRLNDCIRLLCKATGTSFFRFEASESSEFGSSFRPRRPSRPVIFKALSDQLSIGDISFIGGLADDF